MRGKTCGDQATTATHIRSNKSRTRKAIPCHLKISRKEIDRQTNLPINMRQRAPNTVEPSGPKGDNPATAGPGPTKAQSGTPENRLSRINPSAPEDANTTPRTTREK
jgi:hypothetical protein